VPGQVAPWRRIIWLGLAGYLCFVSVRNWHATESAYDRLTDGAATVLVGGLLMVAAAILGTFGTSRRLGSTTRGVLGGVGALAMMVAAMFLAVVSFQGDGPCCARTSDPPEAATRAIGFASCESDHVRVSLAELRERRGSVTAVLQMDEVANRSWWPEAMQVNTTSGRHESFDSGGDWEVLEPGSTMSRTYRKAAPAGQAWSSFSLLYIGRDGEGTFRMTCDVRGQGLPDAMLR
jgi:hypothetical protein